MSIWALSLVMTAAILHAIWNFLAKKSLGGTSFVWLYTFTSTVIYSPLVLGVILWTDVSIGWVEVGLIAASALLHLLYAVTLQKGYRIGDFSLIYPIARGIGPMLIAFAAFFILKEELNGLGKMGIFLIICSVFIFTGGFRILRERTVLSSILYGLLIGCMIASYSLLDKYIVSVSIIHPILLNYGTNLGVSLLLFPFAKKHWQDVRLDWSSRKLETIGIGLFNPLAYILVLIAMVHAPVSYVAPVRELSILIGAVLGVVFLKESFGRQRIIAALVMVIGVIMVAVS
ncbi:DMT family transporter [Oceanobacillus sp. FSL W8-0428]|uniref:DMT transporter permease n=1 Tax=Oceanobacillus sojae TaxID=582851 RepID=A0A511ZJW1_9BACI|nr:DMT family transporter [Oceanobacillus sojae]GEN87742.1 DMT transporter permease [Oceanobacillus sojae]